MLRSEPTRFPGLGISIRLPDLALIETATMGATQTINVRAPDASWSLAIEEHVVRDSRMTAAQVSAQVIRDLQASRTAIAADDSGRPLIGSQAIILDQRNDARIGGREAAKFYARVPRADGEKIALGHAVVAREPGRFLALSLRTTPDELDRARRVFDAVIETVVFPDAADVAADRAAAVRAGNEFLARLAQQDFDAALPREARWFRIYRPASTGAPGDATEVAYQRVEVKRGTRAEIAARRAPDEPEPAGETGYIARVVARYVEPGRVVDIDSAFFASVSGLAGVGEQTDEEAWSVRMGIREGADSSVWTETGARQGNRLTVRITAPGAPPTEKQWLAPERGYIAQTLTHLLPRLLARQALPIACGFYAYTSTAQEVTLRRESLEPAPSGGGWVLRTRIGEGVAERITLLSREGDILRIETGDGTIVEPVQIEALQKLWKSKGLPTD